MNYQRRCGPARHTASGQHDPDEREDEERWHLDERCARPHTARISATMSSMRTGKADGCRVGLGRRSLLQRRKIREQRREVARRTRRVDPANPVGVLVGVQTSGGQVLTQFGRAFSRSALADP